VDEIKEGCPLVGICSNGQLKTEVGWTRKDNGPAGYSLKSHRSFVLRMFRDRSFQGMKAFKGISTKAGKMFPEA